MLYPRTKETSGTSQTHRHWERRKHFIYKFPQQKILKNLLMVSRAKVHSADLGVQGFLKECCYTACLLASNDFYADA
jgi:hypothetical protein